MAPTPTERLRELGLSLPPPPRAVGSYVPVTVVGPLAFVSGQVVTENGAVVSPGLVDRDVPADAARDLIARATLQGLSAIAAQLGSLDRVQRVLRVGVFVASSEGFYRQHEIANGSTDLLRRVFGDDQSAVRTTVGVARLPLNAPIEVDLVAAVA